MPGPIATLLAKGLKQAPQGVDKLAHSVNSVNESGKQVTDPLALATHVNRGRLGSTADEANAGVVSSGVRVLKQLLIEGFDTEGLTQSEFVSDYLGGLTLAEQDKLIAKALDFYPTSDMPVVDLLDMKPKEAVKAISGPQGIDKSAYTNKTIRPLLTAIKDPLAKGANFLRGGGNPGFYAAKEGPASQADMQYLKDYIGALNAMPTAEYKVPPGFGELSGKSFDDLAGITYSERISKAALTKALEGAKIILDKPVYLVRSDNAFADVSIGDMVSSTLHSASVIDPLKVSDHLKHYADPESDTPARIFKLERGQAIYSTMLQGDDISEVLVANRDLRSATQATTQTYHDALKKGSPLFAAAGIAAGVNPDEANAQGDPSVDTELTTKIQGMLEGGTKATTIQEALAKKYQPDEVSQIMQQSMQPKIDALLAKGVPEETIMEAFRAKGLTLPTASPSNSQADQPQDPATADAPPSSDTANYIIPNADGTQPGVDAPASTDVKPEDVLAKLHNLTFTYEEMGSSLAGWTGMAPGLKAKAEEMKKTTNAVILQELQKQGIDAVGFNDSGEVLVKGQDGSTQAYDDTILDSMLASKYEIGASVIGGISGARLGGQVGAPFGGLGKAAGIVIGGAIGSAAGAFGGRGNDILANARDLNYEVSTTELLAKMKDAGIADLTMGALGTSTFQLIKGGSKVTGRLLAKGYDQFITGNLDGAKRALLTIQNMNDARAVHLMKSWETFTGQKALTDEARATGKLTRSDTGSLIRVLTETQPGLETAVAHAAAESKSGGALLSAQIDARAKDITREASSLTNDNIDVVVQDKLGKYISDTKDFFEQVKTLGVEAMVDKPYRFDFSATALLPAMKDAVKGIHNSALRKDFYHYMQQISELGMGEAVATVVKTKGIKPTTKAAVRQEASQATRIAKLELTQAKKTKLGKLAKTRDTALAKAKLLKTVKGRKAAAARARENFAKAKIVAEKSHLGKLTAINAKHTSKLANASVMPELKASDVEAAQPHRGFNNLLELRKTINELRSDNRFKSFANTQQLKLALLSVDTEIQKAALEHMPNGKTWVAHWKAANTEYSNMKLLEHNVLFKVLTSPRVDATVAVRAITRSIMYTNPSTFMQVMGKLPTQTRKSVEGAVLKHLVEKNTVGFEAGKQAINFPTLAIDLEKVAMTQPEARALKRVVTEFASVFKNDPHLLAASGNLPLPQFQSFLGANLETRLKIVASNAVFRAIQARIPFNTSADRSALVNKLSKVLDSPKSAKLTKDILRELPNDPELKTVLHQLAIQFTEKGVPEHYGKVPIYRVHKPGEANKVAETALGKGVLYYTDKQAAQSIAKQTGAKVKEAMQLHKRIATPEDITKILGREPSKDELKDPEVLQLLRNKDFAGIAVGDKVMLFK